MWMSKRGEWRYTVSFCPNCNQQITWHSKDGRRFFCDKCGMLAVYSKIKDSLIFDDRLFS